ncbi:GlcG/HbpS family heme-binding protein [Pseudomonas amygdali]|uniref:GlcG/HbpS family heme-binding protein n=1 Tax=Pseudomonas amygdali TaxID=47877 RepID=UPI001FB5D684|nr:heme-binding protein [Pseudomonas amygdali]UPT36775.1 heme-binding protein [Pseudomonas amygdali pv. loropetali]
MKKIICGVAMACAVFSVQPTFAQSSPFLTDTLIAKLSDAALQEAKKQGVDISISVVDEKGWPLYFKRYGDAMLVTTVLVPNKAYTAAVLRMPSGDLAKLTQPSQPLYGINTADPRVVLFAGGYPLFNQGKLVGAFGVGGGSWEQDEKIGQSVLKAFDAELR